MTKKKWTSEEDTVLKNVMAEQQGSKHDWPTIAKLLSSQGVSRNSNQIRDRWLSYHAKREQKLTFSLSENVRLFELHASLGCHWKTISENFPGKTDNQIKNMFFAQIRKSLRKAKKLTSKHNSPDIINSFKPKVLSNFVKKDMKIPSNLWCEKKGVGWLSTNPVQIKDFIIHFAFAQSNEVELAKDAKVSKIVEYILEQLEAMNNEYVDHHSPEEAETTFARMPTITESQLSRNISMKMHAREFKFYLDTAKKDLEAPGANLTDLKLIFAKMSEICNKISHELDKTGLPEKDIRDLWIIFKENEYAGVGPEDLLPPNMTNLNGKTSRTSRFHGESFFKPFAHEGEDNARGSRQGFSFEEQDPRFFVPYNARSSMNRESITNEVYTRTRINPVPPVFNPFRKSREQFNSETKDPSFAQTQ